MSDIQAAKSAIPLPSAELNLGGTSTNEKQFLTASAQNGVASGTTLICYTPGTNILKSRPFTVRVGGRVTAGTAGTFTVSLYWGTSTTSTSNTKVATVSSALGAASSNFNLELEGRWDSLTAGLQGVQSGWCGGTIKSPSVVSTSTSSVDLSGESTSNGFTVTGTFGTGNASNVAYIDYFEVLTM